MLRADGTPRYARIAEELRRELRGEGECLPSEHRLCARFGVSRPTIRQALDVLAREGRLYRRPGRGTFSTPAPGGDRRLRVIESVGDIMALGDETWLKLLSREDTRPPADVAQALRLPPGSVATRVVGVRHGDVGPFQHVTAWVSAALGTALAHEDLARTSLVAAIERHAGVPIKFLEQSVEATLVSRRVAELLEVRPRTPVLVFHRTYYAVSGEPVEHAVLYHLPRRYPYRMVLARAQRRVS